MREKKNGVNQCQPSRATNRQQKFVQKRGRCRAAPPKNISLQYLCFVASGQDSSGAARDFML